MKAINKILILFVLSFSTMVVYSQCETYLQKANALFAEKKYEDAKRQYSNYNECKPNATGIDEKIAECDRLLKEKDAESNNNRIGTEVTTHQTNSNNSQNEEAPKSTKATIGIGNFSGFKSQEWENIIIQCLTHDERFFVKKIQRSGWDRNPQSSDDIDYIISATSNCTQRGRTETTGYTNIPATKFTRAQRIPITKNIPEIVEIVMTVTDAKTGQILVNQTENGNSISSFIERIWQ